MARTKRRLLTMLTLATLGAGCFRIDYQEISDRIVDAGSATHDASSDSPKDGASLDGSVDGAGGLTSSTRLRPQDAGELVLSGDAGAGGALNDAAALDDRGLGIWSGRVHEGSYQYDLCMTVTQVSEAGAAAGTTVYTMGYMCSGQLTYVQSVAGVYTFTEYFPASGDCAFARDAGSNVDGRIEATPNADGSLGWQWFVPGDTTVFAHGTLEPVAVCP